MKEVLQFKFFMGAWALLLLCIMLVSCAGHVKKASFRKADVTRHMLIASSASEFKDAVRSRIIDNYKDEANIEVINISNLSDIQQQKYDVILIMDSCWVRSHLNLSVKDFLDNVKNKDHVILFLTTGSDGWDYEYRDVDAITSASIIENEQAVFESLRKRIDEILFATSSS